MRVILSIPLIFRSFFNQNLEYRIGKSGCIGYIAEILKQHWIIWSVQFRKEVSFNIQQKFEVYFDSDNATRNIYIINQCTIPFILRFFYVYLKCEWCNTVIIKNSLYFLETCGNVPHWNLCSKVWKMINWTLRILHMAWNSPLNLLS